MWKRFADISVEKIGGYLFIRFLGSKISIRSFLKSCFGDSPRRKNKPS